MRGFSIKLQNLILSAVIVGVVVMISIIGWFVYSGMNQTVIEGFSRKLSAISSVMTAFIDAEDHQLILTNAPRMRALTGAGEADFVYGVASSQEGSALGKINIADGTAGDSVPLEVKMTSLASSPDGKILYGLDGRGSQVQILDPETGMISSRFEVPKGSRCLAVNPATGLLVIATGEGLVTLDSEFAEVKPYSSSEAVGAGVDEMVFVDERTLAVYRKGEATLTVIQTDASDGISASLRTLDLIYPSESDEEEPVSIEETLLALADSSTPGEVFATTDRLVRIDLATGECQAGEMVPLFGYEEQERYRKYVDPMSRIKDRTDLTYLYTLTLSESMESDEGAEGRIDHAQIRHMIYVLDANTDDDHTTVGTPDADPADEPTRDVFFKGKSHLSDIKYWEEWGLIKTGYAPISDSTGRIVAISGADVNVDVIKQRTKAALVKVVLISLLALLVGSAISILVSRKLIEPIDRLKDVALRIAAGQHGERIANAGVKELSELSQTFNALSETLEEKVTSLETTNKQREEKRCEFELVHRLTLRDADLTRYGAWVELLSSCASFEDPSGWTNWGHFVVGWIAPDCGDRDRNLSFRVSTTALSSYFLRKTEGDRDAMREIVEPIMGERLHLAFLIDLKRNEMNTVWWSGEPVLWKQGKDGVASSYVPLGEGVIPLEPNTQYLLCRDAELADCLSEWEAGAGSALVSHFKEKIVERSHSGDTDCSAIGVNIVGSRQPIAI